MTRSRAPIGISLLAIHSHAASSVREQARSYKGHVAPQRRRPSVGASLLANRSHATSHVREQGGSLEIAYSRREA
jgi:hypothetical protein